MDTAGVGMGWLEPWVLLAVSGVAVEGGLRGNGDPERSCGSGSLSRRTTHTRVGGAGWVARAQRSTDWVLRLNCMAAFRRLSPYLEILIKSALFG